LFEKKRKKKKRKKLFYRTEENDVKEEADNHDENSGASMIAPNDPEIILQKRHQSFVQAKLKSNN
jgi:hypothetical protein